MQEMAGQLLESVVDQATVQMQEAMDAYVRQEVSRLRAFHEATREMNAPEAHVRFAEMVRLFYGASGHGMQAARLARAGGEALKKTAAQAAAQAVRLSGEPMSEKRLAQIARQAVMEAAAARAKGAQRQLTKTSWRYRNDPLRRNDAIGRMLARWQETRAAGLCSDLATETANRATLDTAQAMGRTVVWRANAGACEFCRQLHGQAKTTGGKRQYFSALVAADATQRSLISADAAEIRKKKRYRMAAETPPLHSGCRCQLVIGEKIGAADYPGAWKKNSEGWYIVDSMGKTRMTMPKKQFGEKCGDHAKDYGLDPSNAEDREKLRNIIAKIVLESDGTGVSDWREYKDARVYWRGDDVVLATSDNEFITVMRGGITNKRLVWRGVFDGYR